MQFTTNWITGMEEKNHTLKFLSRVSITEEFPNCAKTQIIYFYLNIVIQ